MQGSRRAWAARRSGVHVPGGQAIRVAENAYREIARLSHGAYCRFDTGAAHQLGELLRAVAAYAAGGIKALADLSTRREDRRAQAPSGAARNSDAAMIILGLVVLVLALWALNVVSKVDPRVGARVLKAGGGPSRSAWPRFSACAAKSASPFRSAPSASGCSAGCRSAPPALPRARKKAPARPRACARPILEMQLDHDSGAMRGRIVAGRHKGVDLDRLDVQHAGRACSATSTRKAARYWWRILTAGIPAGVNTRKVTRRRGRRPRPAAK